MRTRNVKWTQQPRDVSTTSIRSQHNAHLVKAWVRMVPGELVNLTVKRRLIQNPTTIPFPCSVTLEQHTEPIRQRQRNQAAVYNSDSAEHNFVFPYAEGRIVICINRPNSAAASDSLISVGKYHLTTASRTSSVLAWSDTITSHDNIQTRSRIIRPRTCT
jgi:hypothetical protein